jgi:DNA-3-methyladenine glycosylase II
MIKCLNWRYKIIVQKESILTNMDAEEYCKGIKYLSRKDPKLRWIISNVKLKENRGRVANFEALAGVIIGQQLSGAAADTIFSRLKNLSKSEVIEPAFILSLEDYKMREIGISHAKINYIKMLAGHLIQTPDFLSELASLDTRQVIKKLTSVKGIGIWTASIFSMFYLGNPNVFADADTSILKAIRCIYGEKYVMCSDDLEKLKETWSPFQTVACLLLWSWVDARMPEIEL